jgi:diguanylate cyclase (GGDEF)-like protein
MEHLRETLTGPHALRWWTYRLSPALERRFATETNAARNGQIRFWVAAGLVLSWLTFVADLISIPDVWRLTLLLRLCVVTPISLVAIWLLAETRPRLTEMVACVAPPAACLLAILLGFAASAFVDPFRSAIVLCIGILWTNVLIPMRFLDTVAFTLITLVLGDTLNIAEVYLHQTTIDHLEVIIVSHGLVVLSVVSRFISERESRRTFGLGLRLQIRAEDLARSNARLLEMSHTDGLTGLANRRFFDLALAQAWQSAAAARSPVAVMMIDVDHFKLFNDAAGHLEGDRCLTVIARAITDAVRADHDLAARFGGEEFVVLMPATEHDEAHKIAERVRAAISALQLFHPGLVGRSFVTVSIGIAAMSCDQPAARSSVLLGAADAALYAAKAAGRDRIMSANETGFVAASSMA